MFYEFGPPNSDLTWELAPTGLDLILACYKPVKTTPPVCQTENIVFLMRCQEPVVFDLVPKKPFLEATTALFEALDQKNDDSQYAKIRHYYDVAFKELPEWRQGTYQLFKEQYQVALDVLTLEKTSLEKYIELRDIPRQAIFMVLFGKRIGLKNAQIAQFLNVHFGGLSLKNLDAFNGDIVQSIFDIERLSCSKTYDDYIMNVESSTIDSFPAMETLMELKHDG
ncbi:MAG: hypothetical protein Q9200_006533 [Gallowayella weberi]